MKKATCGSGKCRGQRLFISLGYGAAHTPGDHFPSLRANPLPTGFRDLGQRRFLNGAYTDSAHTMPVAGFTGKPRVNREFAREPVRSVRGDGCKKTTAGRKGQPPGGGSTAKGPTTANGVPACTIFTDGRFFAGVTTEGKTSRAVAGRREMGGGRVLPSTTCVTPRG